MFGMPLTLINSPVLVMLTSDCSNCRSPIDKWALALNDLVEVAMMVCFELTCCLRRKLESDWLCCEQKMDRVDRSNEVSQKHLEVSYSLQLPANLDDYLNLPLTLWWVLFPYSIFSFPRM